MSSIISIAAPPIGITFGIISGVASAVNMINVSIFKKSQTKCQKYSSIINIIQIEMNLLIRGALDDNISQQKLEIITEHYEKYTLNTHPRGPNSNPFDSTASHFRDTGLSKIGMHRMTPE